MTLAAGARLGPYVIVGAIGAGGMGEVYKARDTRLNRIVAIKIIAAQESDDPERRRRFQREARAVASLDDPHIAALYDVGCYQGSDFLVMEYLEGETLSDRLAAGSFTINEALSIGIQIADALDKAHCNGIVHRDLKPGNVILSTTGGSRRGPPVVKLLDFGLARVPAVDDGSKTDTLEQFAAPAGTLAYMAPEQLEGKKTDARTDIFAFGAVLHEMVTGHRAFDADSSASAVAAILDRDPPAPSTLQSSIPPALDRTVKRCLAKDPNERWQSAADLADELRWIAEGGGSTAAPVEPAAARRPVVRAPLAALLVVAAVACAAVLWVGRRSGPTAPPSFQQLTFRRGAVRGPRFGPEGQILFQARWEGETPRLFWLRPGVANPAELQIPQGTIFAVSQTGELLIGMRPEVVNFGIEFTLARVPLTGGTPRELLAGVQGADWSADGKEIAVVRDVGGRNHLEFPIGTLLYKAANDEENFGSIRVSPTADSVAFVDYDARNDERGSVAIVDRKGKKQTLSRGWIRILNLAWAPGGTEIWFSGTRSGCNCALYAVTLSGRERSIIQVPGALVLHDIARDGRVALIHQAARTETHVVDRWGRDRDLSWFDATRARDLSPDGRLLLFDESGEAEGCKPAVYLRSTDGAPAVRLGEGTALALSPDGRWVASSSQIGAGRLMLLPTGASATGQPRTLMSGAPISSGFGWFPDSRRYVVARDEPGRGVRLYVDDLTRNTSAPVSPYGVTLPADDDVKPVSPDGKWVIGADGQAKMALYPVEGGSPRPLPGIGRGETPVQWSADGRSLFLFHTPSLKLPADVYLLDVATQRRRLWKQLTPPDAAGVAGILRVLVTPDGLSFAYTYYRESSDLFVASGLK